MAIVQIEFPDKTVKEFPQGITALEVAKSIGPRLAADALAAKLDGRLVDLSRPNRFPNSRGRPRYWSLSPCRRPQ